MENPGIFAALAYYIVSSFLDPIQWLICGICGWKTDRVDHAVIAGVSMVSILFLVLAYVYPEGKLFSFPTPHVGIAILGKAIGAGIITALIYWLKQKQLGRKEKS